MTEFDEMQNLLEVNSSSSQLHDPHYFRACGMKNKSEKVYNNGVNMQALPLLHAF